jgi:hypothetical protein
VPPPSEIDELWDGMFDWLDDYEQGWVFEKLYPIDRLPPLANPLHSRNHDLEPALLQVHHSPVTNRELLKVYPKLDISITHALYDWLISLGTKAEDSESNPCYITLLLDVTNRRHPTIEVETYKLTVSVKGKEHTAFADLFFINHLCQAVSAKK